jgi:CDP-diglyceride synthetase
MSIAIYSYTVIIFIEMIKINSEIEFQIRRLTIIIIFFCKLSALLYDPLGRTLLCWNVATFHCNKAEPGDHF